MGESGKYRFDYSIIIITYRRDEAVIENLDSLHWLESCGFSVEIVVVDNNEDELCRREIFDRSVRAVNYVKLGENRGVAGGRMAGASAASGRLLLFLDDDAYICNRSVLSDANKFLNENPKVAVLAAKSRNFFSGKITPEEFPHANKSLPQDELFKTYRFIGVAHIVRSDVFDQVEGYDQEFFYGMEEFDLSFQIIKMGWEIWYFPSLEVLHKKLPSGRLPPVESFERQWSNKLKVAFWHLPLLYFISVCVVWTGFVLYKSKFSLNLFSSAMRLVSQIKRSSRKRVPLDGMSLRYLKQVEAPLWK